MSATDYKEKTKMKNILTIKNIRGYLDKNGTAHLNLEDVAKGLGFISNQEKNGKIYEVVRWSRVREHLTEFNFLPRLAETEDKPTGKEGIPDFIPENIVYKLCFKASNETARKFQDLVCDEILPTIRKTGTYSVDGYNKKSTSVGEVTNLIKTLKSIMKDQDHKPDAIANMAQIVCEQFGVVLPVDFSKKPLHEQLTLLAYHAKI